jgi:hypothetical protein
LYIAKYPLEFAACPKNYTQEAKYALLILGVTHARAKPHLEK